MVIQVGGTTVIDDSRNLINVTAATYVQGDGARGRSVSRTNGTANNLTDPSGFYFGNAVTGMPTTDWWNWNQTIGNLWSDPDGYGWQQAVSFWSDDIRIRRLQSGVWREWTTVLHTSMTASTNIRFNSLGVGTAASGTAGEIRSSDNITAYFSDRRLKTNICIIDNALDKVNQISGVTFQSNDVAAKYGYINKKIQVGVIAQEIEAVLPEVVVPAPFDIGQNEDGTEYSKSGQNYKTVQYEKIVPLLIEAIKELKTELDAIKEKIK
jgi:hypothetical protein